MKKVSVFAALFVCLASTTFANKTVITASGTKTGPTTVSSNGSVTFNCDGVEGKCAEVTIETSGLQVQPGDPTTVETYAQGQVDFQTSGKYGSITNIQEQDGTLTWIVSFQ